MSINGTYGQLKRQIADELGDRPDLSVPLSDSGLSLSPIENAIQSAIAKWEREPFYFNEVYNDPLFTTSAGQEFYSSVTSPVAVPQFATIFKIAKVRVLINNNRYVLNARSWQYLEEIQVNPSIQSEFPIDFAYFSRTMRFYPIPGAAIPVTVSDNERLGFLVADDDANAWTGEGYDLIRSEAKLIIAQEVLCDDDLASRMKTAIYGDYTSPNPRQQTHGYLYGLQAETTRRGHARIRPSHF